MGSESAETAHMGSGSSPGGGGDEWGVDPHPVEEGMTLQDAARPARQSFPPRLGPSTVNCEEEAEEEGSAGQQKTATRHWLNRIALALPEGYDVPASQWWRARWS